MVTASRLKLMFPHANLKAVLIAEVRPVGGGGVGG